MNRFHTGSLRRGPAGFLIVTMALLCGQYVSAAPLEAVGNGSLSAQDPGYKISSSLCEDEAGPDCARLRLGDDYLTRTRPARGYLYSCSGKNPRAPGSMESKITWIDFTGKTWNFFDKLWLPSGSFSPAPGIYRETVNNGIRRITVNNLPVDGKIGDWPMTRHGPLTAIDRNPGMPAPRNYTFSYPAIARMATSPACVPLGAVGVTRNGVLIFSAVDGRGEDAVAREIVDQYGGHPARSEYHYHFIPEHLDDETLSDKPAGPGHSGIVGYINDGFPIYGYRGEAGIELSNSDLDLCHGHEHGSLRYHYHATIEYPYTVGCYRGVPVRGAAGNRRP